MPAADEVAAALVLVPPPPLPLLAVDLRLREPAALLVGFMLEPPLAPPLEAARLVLSL